MSYADSDLCGTMTVFHITLEVAKNLKSLFEFICESLVRKACTTLNFYTDSNYQQFRKLNDRQELLVGSQLLFFILESLETIFMHNRMDSILVKTYEDLVNSLVILMEIPLDNEAMESQLLEKVNIYIYTCIYIYI